MAGILLAGFVILFLRRIMQAARAPANPHVSATMADIRATLAL